MPSFTSGRPSFALSRGDADVARQRELAAAAEREAVHRGDHRLGRLLEAREHPLAATIARARPSSEPCVGELRDVRAGHEGLGARAGDDHAANVLAARYLIDRRPSSAIVASSSALSLSGRLIVIVATRSRTSKARLV